MKSNRLNEVNKNTYGTEMKIIEYIDCHNIIVEFQDEYKYKKRSNYQQFLKGNVKNPYDKEVYGVGYMGVGKYKSRDENGKKTKCYHTWLSMIQRCYNEDCLMKHPTYKDCYVCEEWHNFQNFAEWYEENYYSIGEQRIQLDKDILCKGNKIYSPNTCIFVPQRINSLFTKCDKSRGELPIGCSYDKGWIRISCSNGKGKGCTLGLFTDVHKAWLMYKLNKELVIQSIADEYKDLIPKKLYKALYDYRIDIND